MGIALIRISPNTCICTWLQILTFMILCLTLNAGFISIRPISLFIREGQGLWYRRLGFIKRAGANNDAFPALCSNPVMPAPHERLPRERRHLAAAALAVIALGLLTRANLPLPALIVTYGGDTLYATLIVLLIALLWPQAPRWRVGLLALGFCVAVEVSQLARAPWLDAIRATLPGRLILGAGFLWSDLACYAVGVLLGIALDLALRRRR